MAKRGENIYKRKDGRWEGRYIKERTVQNRIVYGYVYGKKYQEVKNKLTLLKAKHLVSTNNFNQYQSSYREWLTNWLNKKAKKKVKATTYSNYFRLIQKHIIPSLGSYTLKDLGEETLQQFVDYLLAKNLSPGSIRLIFSIVQQSLNEAVKQQYLFSNPCKYVELPKPKPAIIKSLNKKEQYELEKLAFQDPECSPVLLALYSGMRIGEISGLKWDDIDFESGWIRVNRTISRIIDEHSPTNKTELIAGTPKTTQSSRIIPLAANLKAYLLKKKEKAKCEYVIHSQKRIAEPRVINYRFKKLIQNTSFSSIHFHILRHTFATRCLEQGVDIASLSRILGHSSTKLTLDTYADSILEHRQEVMKAVDALMIK